jgi:hypothetical protein
LNKLGSSPMRGGAEPNNNNNSCLKCGLAAINNKLCIDAKDIENEMKGVMSHFKKLDQKIDQLTGIT